MTVLLSPRQAAALARALDCYLKHVDDDGTAGLLRCALSLARAQPVVALEVTPEAGILLASLPAARVADAGLLEQVRETVGG